MRNKTKQTIGKDRIRNALWRKLHPNYAKQKYQEAKRKVLLHYSKGSPICSNCGTTDNLSIDYVNGGGNEHRREIGIPKGGYGFYLWLIRNNYPIGYQVLCVDCNRIRR